MNIRKRDGKVVPFDAGKIRSAVLKALSATGMPSDSVAERVAKDAVEALKGVEEPQVEQIQDAVETALMKRGLTAAAKAYILYRDEHARAREALRVRRAAGSRQSVTDKAMMIATRDSVSIGGWDRGALARALASAGLGTTEADNVAKQVEDKLIATGLRTVNAALVREMANSVMADLGLDARLKDETVYTVPKDFVDGLMGEKVNENSNISNNNPEAVAMAISGLVQKQYLFDRVLSDDIAVSHSTGRIYVHDADFPTRVYCSSHSIEYLKKYGLRGLLNLNTSSKPAKSASVLTGHLNTFLASMQANYAGALGLGFVNVFYAPLVDSLDDREMHQVAQELVFNISQNAFSRGGQTLFVDINVCSGVPSYLKNVPAIGPGGKYQFRAWQGAEGERLDTLEEAADGNGDWCLWWTHPDTGSRLCVLREHDGKQEFPDTGYGQVKTYGDYQDAARRFAHALLDVWGEGDADGRLFAFPKCDFHVSAESFTGPEQYKVFQHACRLAASNGSTYFVFDRDSVSLASCCRLRVQITDMSLLMHPERLRTCGFMNVTVNVPQAAYRAAHAGKPTLDGLLEQVDEAMDLAVKAELQKKAFVETLMSGPGKPLWQLGKTACDGRPYLETKDCTYIIGMIGVNDAVHYLLGKEMHESEEAMDMALRIAGHMYLRTKEYTKQYGLQFKLEESPAESAARKLAKTDLVYWREDALKVYKGWDEDHAFYTNSIHLSADAPVSLTERIKAQSRFNSIIEAGAITHAFIGEERPSAEAIEQIVRNAYLLTQSAQITFSPEVTYCRVCGAQMRGIHDRCEECGADDVLAMTRVVGYFSAVRSWNASKQSELSAREHGDYAVAGVELAGEVAE